MGLSFGTKAEIHVETDGYFMDGILWVDIIDLAMRFFAIFPSFLV